MKTFILTSLTLLLLGLTGCGLYPEEEEVRKPLIKPDKPIQVGVYYIPRTIDQAKAVFEQMSKGSAHFPEQFQPKQPMITNVGAHGVYRRDAKLAAEHGVDAFIIDWYCNKTGPYDNPIIKQIQSRRLRSTLRHALIWRNDHEGNQGANMATGAEFRKTIDLLVEEYFSQKAYWKPDHDKVFFSIYDLKQFVAGFEDMELAKRSLRMLRNRTSAYGLEGLHLNGTTHGLTPEEAAEYKIGLELDSITHFNWIDTGLATERPGMDYTKLSDAYFAALEAGEGVYGVGYAPSVTMGWDPAPLWAPGEEWKTATEYPYGPVITGNNGARFTKALGLAKERVRENGPPFVLIHAWNDWLHGSHLEPEAMFKNSYINGVKEEFINRENIDLRRLLRWRLQNR